MEPLELILLISFGISLIIGYLILMVKKDNRFYFPTGIFTLKPIVSAIWIIGSTFLLYKVGFSSPLGYRLIIYFLPDFLFNILLVIIFRDIVLESWLAVFIYFLESVRWLFWLALFATFTDYIGVIEIIQMFFHVFVAVIYVSILFIWSKQSKDLRAEIPSSYERNEN